MLSLNFIHYKLKTMRFCASCIYQPALHFNNLNIRNTDNYLKTGLQKRARKFGSLNEEETKKAAVETKLHSDQVFKYTP